jgi:hypothetical protein
MIKSERIIKVTTVKIKRVDNEVVLLMMFILVVKLPLLINMRRVYN